MDRRILFHGPDEIALAEYELPNPGPGEVTIRTRRTLISSGTEGIVLHRRFESGTHWEGWATYPFKPGYCAVGVIEAVGADVPPERIGQRVVSRTAHASAVNRSAELAYPIPDGLSDEEAPWFALAKIAYVGARAGEFALGRSVLIVGAGPIGQMALRWAVAAGSRATMLDPLANRLEHGRSGGAAATIPLAAGESEEEVRAAFDGELPEIVVDTTGHPLVFAQTLPLVADRGRLVLLGDAGAPSQQRLTLDVIRRGLTIVGAHDLHLPEAWSSYAPFFDLAASGRFSVAGLTTHVFRPEDFRRAYDLATHAGEAMGVQFDWTEG